MRIRLLTDIHEEVPHLRTALAILAAEGADAIVQLGDACDLFGPGRGTAEVTTLLADAGVIGVWGNHDVGFCHEVPEEVRARAEPHTLAYMAEMKGRLELAGCHFSHVEPWLDPHSVLDLWYFDGPPDTPEKAARSFAAVPHRVLFLGHFHRWLVMSDHGRVEWDATRPLSLAPDRRHLVVVGPLVSGQFGLYDTDTHLLTPFRC
jgi:predicted phosphodiesterase